MTKLLLFVVIALTISRPTFAAEQAAHTCGKLWVQLHSVSYCIDQPKNQSSDVIYYLHGIYSNADEFAERYSQPFLDVLSQHGPAPTVISISLGPVWLLIDDNIWSHDGTRTLFVNHIMPAAEAKLAFKPARRFVMGESMGGWNAIQLQFKNADLFDGFIMVSPAISAIAPSSNILQLSAYAKSTPGTHLDLLVEERSIVHVALPTPALWAAHNPLELVKKSPPRISPTFMTLDSLDEFGFFPGQSAFAAAAPAVTIPFFTEVITGGAHCQQTDASLAAMVNFFETQFEQ